MEEKSETAYATLFGASPPNGSVAKEKQDAEIPIINSPPKIIRMKFCFTQDDDCDKYMLSHHQSVARRLDPYGVGTDPGDKTTSSLEYSSSDEEEEGDDIEYWC